MLPDQNCYASTLPAKRFYTTQAHKRHAAKPCSNPQGRKRIAYRLAENPRSSLRAIIRGNGPTAPSVASITPHILKQLGHYGLKKAGDRGMPSAFAGALLAFGARCCPGPHAVRNSELARTDYRGEYLARVDYKRRVSRI